MQDIITIDALTKGSVSVKVQKTIVQDGVTYEIGEPHRCAYVNSESGRAKLSEEVPEPYLSAVMAVWGDDPTIKEPAEGGETK